MSWVAGSVAGCVAGVFSPTRSCVNLRDRAVDRRRAAVCPPRPRARARREHQHLDLARRRAACRPAAARRGTVLVATPEGVEGTTPEPPLTLAAWGEASLSAPLVNRTALGGSRYPVFVAAEYDDGGVHQAVIGQGTLEITNPRSFFQSQRQLLWIVAAAVVAGWLGFLLWQVSTGRLRRAAPRG